MTIGSRIERVLEKLGKSKSDLARDLGISTASVTNFCKGRNNPSGQTIDQICDKYGVVKSWLLTGEGEPFLPVSREEEIGKIAADAAKTDPEEARRFFMELFGKKTDAQILLMYQLYREQYPE